MIYHPSINGRPESFPVKCHGENTELRKGYLGHHKKIQSPEEFALVTSALNSTDVTLHVTGVRAFRGQAGELGGSTPRDAWEMERE